MSAETKIIIDVSRRGNNVFINKGVWGQIGSIHVVSTLKPNHLVIEPGQRAWIEVKTHGRWGMIVNIRQMMGKGQPILKTQTFTKSHGTVVFDPWEYVEMWEE